MTSFKQDNKGMLPNDAEPMAPQLIGSRWVGAYLFIVLSLVVAFIWGYFENQAEVIRQHQLQDQHEAQVAAVIISASFSNYFDQLNLLAQDSQVLKLTRAGRHRLDQLLESEQPLVTAVTQVSQSMKILYTTPDSSSIGADLSSQEHNQLMVSEQRDLVSSPFDAVQGYKAISVAIPLNDAGEFKGSLAMLMDFQGLAEEALLPVSGGEKKQIYLINSNGVIIHSPAVDQVGNSAQAVIGDSVEALDIFKKMINGQTGHGATPGGFHQQQEQDTLDVLVSYAPARLTNDDFWSVCVVTDKQTVLANAAPSRQPFAIAGLFALLVLLVASHLVRVSTKYKTHLEHSVSLRTTALRDSEEKHRLLIESMSEGVVVTDKHGYIELVNPAIEKILSQAPSRLMGTKLSDYIVQGQLPEFLSHLALMQLGKEATCELKTTSPDGEIRDLLIVSKPKLDADQNFVGAVSFIQDFTEKKKTEDNLKMERQVFLGGPVVVFKWAKDIDQPVEYVSPNVTQFGFSVEQWLSGKVKFSQLMHPDDYDSITDEVSLNIESGVTSFEQEYRIVLPDGKVRWVYDFTNIIRDDNGEITHYLGYVFDETEVKRASLVQEVLLEISEAHTKAGDLEALVQEIRNLLGKLIDTTNFFVALHDSATGLFSFPFYTDEKDKNFRAQPLRFTLTEYVHRTGEPLFATSDFQDQMVADGKLKRTGPMSCMWLGAPLKSSEGVFGVVAVQDYTNPKNYEPSDLELLAFVSDHIALAIERKRASTALLKSEESYRQLVEVAQESIITVDDNEVISFTNQAFCSALGFTQEELIGTSLLDLADTSSIPDITKGTLNRIQGMTDTYEIRFIARNGEFKDFISTSSPLTDEHGSFQGSMAVMVDITERKKTEDMILHSQKLESLGILAGGIAHDYNNLLVGIIGNSELALSETSDSSRLRTYLLDIEKAAQRAAELTEKLTAYSGKATFTVGSTNLCDIVVELGRLLGSAIPAQVEIKFNLDHTTPPIQADAAQLRQVIMNLILNATESVDENDGVVVVNVGQQSADNNYLSSQFTSGEFKPGEYAYVEVSDNGNGIPMDDIPKVFDPFYTTKLTGRGLGLAAVLGIINGHKGSIKVYSKIGQGSSFKFLLPIETPSHAPPVVNRKVADQITGVVLLIDDEPTIRKVGSRILGRAGFEVVCAADGIEGLELFKADPGAYDIVVLDLTMPRMGGEEVFVELCKVRPDVKILITSGYSELDTQDKFASSNLLGFMQKPFSPNLLLETIRQHLFEAQT